MNTATYRVSYILITLFTTSMVPIINGLYLDVLDDCTEIIKENSMESSNGTVQFEYLHYPKFWLYRSVVAENQSSESKTSGAEKWVWKDSLVTIVDVEMYPTIANLENSYLWSWKLRGKLRLSII